MARKRAFKAGAGRLLAPEDNVGSSVRHATQVWFDEDTNEPYFRCSMILTDCDRQIEWSGHGTAGIAHQRKKLKGAIAEMQRALTALDAGGAVFLDAKAEWKRQGAPQRGTPAITVDPQQIVEVR